MASSISKNACQCLQRFSYNIKHSTAAKPFTERGLSTTCAAAKSEIDDAGGFGPPYGLDSDQYMATNYGELV